MNLRCRALLVSLGLMACLGIGASARAEAPVVAPAPASGFLTTLSAIDRAAAGVDKLSSDEQAALNNFVAKEAALARAGNVRGFAGTFVLRRTAAERTTAGLDRLTVDEQTKLNELVAGSLASGATSTPTFTRLNKDQVSQPQDRLQVHGEVSFVYGWQKGGGDFKGGSLYVNAYDPVTGISLGVGYAQYEGDGWYGYGPGYYPGGYYSYPAGRLPGGPGACIGRR